MAGHAVPQIAEIGSAAAEAVLHALSETQPPQGRAFVCELVVRGTSVKG